MPILLDALVRRSEYSELLSILNLSGKVVFEFSVQGVEPVTFQLLIQTFHLALRNCKLGSYIYTLVTSRCSILSISVALSSSSSFAIYLSRDFLIMCFHSSTVLLLGKNVALHWKTVLAVWPGKDENCRWRKHFLWLDVKNDKIQ